MKNIKSNVAKSLVLIALFCPVAFADGEQGSGGFAEGTSCTSTTQYSLGGEQGSGGLTSLPCEDSSNADSVFNRILNYLESMI